MRPGRHGSMSSGELEGIITRNANFLSVRRAGGGDGQAALYNQVNGRFITGIGGGQLPEFSRMLKLKWACECYKPNEPKGLCRTGTHGTGLVRGWRNMLFELTARGHIRVTNEIVRVLGEEATVDAVSKLMTKAPMHDPAPAWEYSSL